MQLKKTSTKAVVFLPFMLFILGVNVLYSYEEIAIKLLSFVAILWSIVSFFKCSSILAAWKEELLEERKKRETGKIIFYLAVNGFLFYVLVRFILFL